MSDKKAQHTPGPWIRDGRLVYALHDKGRGPENRFSAGVQPGDHHPRGLEEFGEPVRAVLHPDEDENPLEAGLPEQF